MTPEKVIQGMAFAEPQRPAVDSSTDTTSGPGAAHGFTQARHEPPVPPPAAPPPSPPISSRSYQRQVVDYSRKGSRGEIPVVTNYSLVDHEQDDLLRQNSARSSSGLRGDVSLRPNTGFHNAADDQAEALLEVLWKMRLMNIGGCIAALLLGLPDFFTHVFTLHPDRLVLNMYRLFFCILLGCYELHTPRLREMIIDNFGLIHHPLGRTLFLVLLSGLCISQGTILDMLVGVLFLLTTIMTFYAYLKYPEYRRLVDEQPDLAAMARRRMVGSSSRISWAQPDMVESIASSIGQQETGEEERRSLVPTFRV